MQQNCLKAETFLCAILIALVLFLPEREDAVTISSFCSLTSPLLKFWPVLSLTSEPVKWSGLAGSHVKQPCGITIAAQQQAALAGQGAEELSCLISVVKPFCDVWYKPLPWCQFHFGSSQMFWWVPVCRFKIPPVPEPRSPVLIVTTCVLVRNARRWFWCNKRLEGFFLFLLVGIEALQANQFLPL